MLDSLPIILFNGVAYGTLLFLMAGGLSITLGLMGFANLAHGAFGMLGGYLLVTLMDRLGWPFPLAVCAAAILTGVAGMMAEQAVFRRFYRANELDQVLMTTAVIFMAVAGASFVWGQSQMPVRVPAYLNGTATLLGLTVTRYRLFLVAVGGLITAGLILAIEYTSFGAKVRAAVDNRRMTMSCGINVDRLFVLAFGLGTGLAGLGGALSVRLVGLSPLFPLQYLTYLMLVVVVGGLGSIGGTLAASLAVGVIDVGSKYFFPEAGSFVVYGLTAAFLLWRPRGLFPRASA